VEGGFAEDSLTTGCRAGSDKQCGLESSGHRMARGPWRVIKQGGIWAHDPGGRRKHLTWAQGSVWRELGTKWQCLGPEQLCWGHCCLSAASLTWQDKGPGNSIGKACLRGCLWLQGQA
jgi:hypothetical protein